MHQQPSQSDLLLLFRFLEELYSLLDVRSSFSKLPLRFCLRWSSAGRALVEYWLSADFIFPA